MNIIKCKDKRFYGKFGLGETAAVNNTNYMLSCLLLHLTQKLCAPNNIRHDTQKAALIWQSSYHKTGFRRHYIAAPQQIQSIHKRMVRFQ
jgi:hypothetical protein